MDSSKGFFKWSGAERVLVPFEPPGRMLDEYRARRKERDRLFLEHGIDRAGMIEFVLGAAGEIAGPALDIGTGRGLTAFALARMGIRTATMDISEDDLMGAMAGAAAEGVAGSIEFHLADANDLPFPDGSFRLVTMVNVLHHMEAGENLLSEVSRVLAPGGRFVVADFDEEGFRILDRLHSGEGEEHKRLAAETIGGIAGKLPLHGLKRIGRFSGYCQDVLVAEKIV
jgi:ubiquinone/menaquinone biosynthesis C-methylase UbiE